MKSKKNVTLLYKKNGIPDNIANALSAADENDLRLMLAISLCAEGERLDCASLAEELGLDLDSLDASIKYWCGAGLIKKGAAKTVASDSQGKTESDMPKSAHKDGKLERSSELPSYSSAELSELIEKRTVTAEFIDEAQRILGKVFNTHEVGILVGMVDYVGFDESSVIIILSEMVKSGKKTLRYAEKLAFSLYDMGIVTSDALLAYFKRLEEQKTAESAVKAMFGMNGRELSAKEKKFLKSWIETMGFDVDCIRLAYDITVDNTQSPAPAYANAILEKWYSEGLCTAEQIKSALAERKTDKGAPQKKNGESFDTEEFFSAALKRSFDEL